jgi:hypothetical protein
MRVWFYIALLIGAGLLSDLARAMQIYPSPADEGGFSYLIADGIIDMKDIGRFRAELNKNAARGIPTAILLTSPGGVLEATDPLSQVILNASHTLFTRYGLFNMIVINEECDSACTVLTSYLSNKRDPRSLQIFATPAAVFGLHSPVVGRYNSGDIQDPEERAEKIAALISAYLVAGVNPTWLANNNILFQTARMTDRSARQLCDQDSRIIPADSCLSNDGDVLPFIAGRMRIALQARAAVRKKNSAPHPRRKPTPKKRPTVAPRPPTSR